MGSRRGAGSVINGSEPTRTEDLRRDPPRPSSATAGRTVRRWAGGAAALLACVLIGMVVLADNGAERSPFGKTIVQVRVEGVEPGAEHVVLGQVKTRPGQPYDRDAIQEDIRNIYGLGRFDSVEPRAEVTDEGVVLTFAVRQRMQIADLEFRGARSIRASKLQGAAGLSAGDYMDPARVALALQEILKLYKDEGYFFADVTIDEEARARGRLVFVIREGPKVRVDRIVFRGNDTVPDADLNKVVETSRYRWLISAGKLDELTVREDVVRLLQHYRDEGYIDARVDYELLPSDDQTRVTVVFVIQEGPRYRIDDIVFQGNTIFQPHQFRGVMLLQPGDYYTAKAVRHDEEAIRRELYGRDGYPYAQVQIVRAFADREGMVNVTVTIFEGERITVGKIEVAGNLVTKDNVIRRELLIQPTEPYNVLAADESRRRLINTALFTKVDIQPEAAGPDGERDVLVLVEEGRTTSFMIGAGVSSDAGLLGTVRIENRNFDLFNWPKTWGQLFSPNAFKGAGQTLSIIAEPGTQINRFQIQFYEPFLRDKPVGLGASVFLFTRPRDSYDETRVGTMVSLNRRIRRDWTFESAFRLEGVSISGVSGSAASDIRSDSGANILLAGRFTLARDTTDNRFLPTRGNRLSLSVEPAGGSNFFAKLQADYRVYRTVRTDIYDRKSTVNTRLAAGYILGRAPVYERFYAGGLSTMRGFAYRGVGPHKGPKDDPVGGHFQVLAGAEYAFPLWGQSQGVFFVDAGTVETDLGLSSFRASVGFEVRIPIEFFGRIPMTIGVGVPVARGSGDDTQFLHFLFGTSF